MDLYLIKKMLNLMMQYKQIFYTKFCTQTPEKLFQFMEDQPFIICIKTIL